MMKLDYNSIGKVLSLTKLQTKSIIVDLEQAKLVMRVLIKNQWYILLLDEAFKMYLNNKSKKHRINKGNIIPASWLNVLKADTGQTDFTGALLLGKIVYFSRVFKRNNQAEDILEFEKEEIESLSTISVSSSSVSHDSISNNEDTNAGRFNSEAKTANASATKLVSKSKGLVSYFKHDHFRKKFPFLSSKVINRTFSRLEKNNIINI